MNTKLATRMTVSVLTMTKDKPFQFRIPKALYEKAMKLAAKKGISLSEYIRFLLIRELEQDEKNNPNSLPSPPKT